MGEETRQCRCGKTMIKCDDGIVLTSYPAQYPWHWWCGGCCFREKGGVRQGKTRDQLDQERWDAANDRHEAAHHATTGE